MSCAVPSRRPHSRSLLDYFGASALAGSIKEAVVCSHGSRSVLNLALCTRRALAEPQLGDDLLAQVRTSSPFARQYGRVAREMIYLSLVPFLISLDYQAEYV